MRTTVAVDCMGGDHGPSVTVPACLEFTRQRDDTDIVLVGLEGAIRAELDKCGSGLGDRLRLHAATQVIQMDEAPASALRLKKDSSIRVAANLVKAGEVHACVSAGNSGANPSENRVLDIFIKIEPCSHVSNALPSHHP